MTDPTNLEHDERRRAQLIADAVSAADRIIMAGSDGPEEVDYMTGAVAQKFAEKVFSRLQTDLMRHDLMRR